MSLDAGKAQLPFVSATAGKPAVALTVAAAAVVVLTACGSSVGSAPGAIGYVGVSYLSQVRGANEGEAALGNTAGRFVLPSARAIQAALSSFTNTPASVVDTSQPSAAQAQDLRAFLSWAVTTGTAQLAKVNFQPLPPSIVTLSDAQIAKIRG